jgi:hypothetical protein
MILVDQMADVIAKLRAFDALAKGIEGIAV